MDMLRKLLRRVKRRLLRVSLVVHLRLTMRLIYRSSFLSAFVAGRYELATSPENLISAEYVDGGFTRYDAIIRLLAVEAYYGDNDFGFDLYNKMQAARGAPEGAEARFRALIQSVEESSFDWKSVLDVTRDGYLWDGSHRLALALYHSVPVVTARVDWKQMGAVRYGLSWFKSSGFSEGDCGLLEARKEQLFWGRGLYFSVVLWPPVASFFDEIECEIGHRVIKSEDYSYSDSNFEHMVRSAYEMDDIAEWKVCKKLTHMAPYEKKVRVLWLDFRNPEYRKKDLNNADISQVGERLKAKIRKKYESKVSNYIYDIICHTGDNWGHNKKMMEIFGN